MIHFFYEVSFGYKRMLKAALQRMTDVFSASTLKSGMDYERLGYVLSIRLSDGLLKARVKGSGNQIYDVHIDLKTWPQSSSRCSCEFRTQCEHAAACLFALRARENLGPPIAHPSVSYDKWRTVTEDHVVEQVVDADEAEWYTEVNESTYDFFSYQLGILIDNQTVSIVPLVIDLIHRMDIETLEALPDSKSVTLPFAKGKVLKIALGRIKPLIRLLLQYVTRPDQNQTELRVKRYQILLLQEAEQSLASRALKWFGTSELQTKLQRLTTRTLLPEITVPQGLKTALRDYQQLGLNWLQYLRELQFGGVLADDMGLGKTVQTLAHLQYEKEQGRLKKASLIVAPTSLVTNWYEEAKRFTPELKVLIFHGLQRHRDDFDAYDLVISTYGLIHRDKARFLGYPFYYLILDEAQLIKNARTKTTQMVQQLQAQHRLCLTGTPLENNLGELWSLFHFLMPGLLGDAKQFRKSFRIPIEKHADNIQRERLVRRVTPFMLRRTKNQVARELPAKTEMTRMLELSGPQRDLYEAIRMSMEKKVREAIAKQGLGKSHIVLLDALLKLRQVCCDPRLLSLSEASIAHDSSIKLTSLMELLDNLMEEGRYVLVFSQFTSMLRLIEQALKKRDYPYLQLTGQTRNRHRVVSDFQEGKAPIFLISLKAGGTGLNLTRADTVIHYDPWWNPAVEDQATDRSHRIGQENPVFVYKLIGAGTVEEVILGMQAKKRQLFEGILSSNMGENMVLTDDDVSELFAPLS